MAFLIPFIEDAILERWLISGISSLRGEASSLELGIQTNVSSECWISERTSKRNSGISKWEPTYRYQSTLNEYIGDSSLGENQFGKKIILLSPFTRDRVLGYSQSSEGGRS